MNKITLTTAIVSHLHYSYFHLREKQLTMAVSNKHLSTRRNANSNLDQAIMHKLVQIPNRIAFHSIFTTNHSSFCDDREWKRNSWFLWQSPNVAYEWKEYLENGGNKPNTRDARSDSACWGTSSAPLCAGDSAIIAVREIFRRRVMSVFVTCCEGADLFGDECECFGLGPF